jgi:hypothetical protein
MDGSSILGLPVLHPSEESDAETDGDWPHFVTAVKTLVFDQAGDGAKAVLARSRNVR